MADTSDTSQGTVTAERPAVENGEQGELDQGAPSDERITGFKPRDRIVPAPNRVSSAIETFTAPPLDGPVTEVDPMAALSEKERREHRDEINGIVKAQRDAETLVGIAIIR